MIDWPWTQGMVPIFGLSQYPHTFCPGEVPYYNGIKAKGHRCFNHVHHKISRFPVGMIPTGTEFF